MISLEEAQAAVFAEIKEREGEEEAPLGEALDRVLARDIVSPLDVPPRDCSAMDGYAVRVEDLAAAGPHMSVTLKVIGEAAAGSPGEKKIWEGEALRIMTGAALPEGAEAVAPVEDTRPRGDRVSILRPFAVGANVRRRGEDIREGALVLPAGTKLAPVHVGLSASLGLDRVMVRRRPLVGILATGNELLEPGRPPREGSIYSSNHYALAAQARRAGGEPRLLGIAPDDREGLRGFLARGMEYPILVTSGGVSVGKYDLVQEVLRELGVQVKFWKVAIKPGKPTLFGVHSRGMVFGLPGYPVASMLCFDHFVRPVIARRLGISWRPSLSRAVLEKDLDCKPGRRQFLRARLTARGGMRYVTPLSKQGSAILSTLSKADCLLVVPPDRERLCAGEVVDVQGWGE